MIDRTLYRPREIIQFCTEVLETPRGRSSGLPLPFFDLADAAGRLVKTYSGGLQRRLDVALGLMDRPQCCSSTFMASGLMPGWMRAIAACNPLDWAVRAGLSGAERGPRPGRRGGTLRRAARPRGGVRGRVRRDLPLVPEDRVIQRADR